MPTCLHFGPQVEVQKVDRIEFKFKISARGFQEAPRVSQERPKRVQERPKSGPRAPQGPPRAFPERPKRVQVTPKTVPGAPKSSQDWKIKVAPYKNTGKLKNSIKHGRKYRFITQKWPKVANMALRSTKAKQMILAGNSLYP